MAVLVWNKENSLNFVERAGGLELKCVFANFKLGSLWYKLKWSLLIVPFSFLALFSNDTY